MFEKMLMLLFTRRLMVFIYYIIYYNKVQGPSVLPNRGDKSIYKRDKKKWAVGNVGSRVKGGHLT
jgi:hypothetical protein